MCIRIVVVHFTSLLVYEFLPVLFFVIPMYGFLWLIPLGFPCPGIEVVYFLSSRIYFFIPIIDFRIFDANQSDHFIRFIYLFLKTPGVITFLSLRITITLCIVLRTKSSLFLLFYEKKSIKGAVFLILASAIS